MIKTVKCVTKGCDVEGQVLTTTALFLNRIAPLDGPFICPKCGNHMKVVARIPANKGKSGKTMPRTTSRPPAKKSIRKKLGTGLKIKIGKRLGSRFKKPPTKAAPKKPGPRKRGPNKS
jgi:hypothetical protein